MTRSVSILMWALLVAGCGKDDAQREEPAEETARPGPGEWTPRVYQALADELGAGCDRPSIPRLGSAAFSDLADSRNLDAHDQPALPFHQRIPRLAELTGPLNQLLKAYFRCNHHGEMFVVATLFMEAQARIVPDLDEYLEHGAYTDALGGVRDMLTGFFTMLKAPTFDAAKVEPYASRFGAAASTLGGFLPADWLPMQLASLRDYGSRVDDLKQRALVDKVLAAAEAR